MNQKILAYNQKYLKNNPAQIKAGDWIKVYQSFKEGKKTRVQVFEGVVLATKHGKGLDATFTVRKIATGQIGVEIVFPLHSPNIIKIERLKSSRASRAKLYYLRNIKSSKITLNKEKSAPKVWEEKLGEEELEKIKAEKELAAKAKKEAKLKVKQELEEKFRKAQATRNTN